jgi:predicted MFS family arabinose efflux permease
MPRRSGSGNGALAIAGGAAAAAASAAAADGAPTHDGVSSSFHSQSQQPLVSAEEDGGANSTSRPCSNTSNPADPPTHPHHLHIVSPRAAAAAATHAVAAAVAPVDRPATAEAEAALLRHPTLSARRRWAMTCLFALQAALLYADQNLLAPNLSAAAAEFGLDDAQKDAVLGGGLMACFFLVGAPAALIVGYMADRVRRVRLLFAVVAIGAAPCLAVYWAKTVPAFFVLRALTGVSVGGVFPLVFSLLGDLFPARRRAATSALVQIATGAGLAAGQALAGTVGQPDALGWRAPFVIAAVPALALNFLMVLLCPEPPRGAFEKMALQEQQRRRLEARGVVGSGVDGVGVEGRRQRQRAAAGRGGNDKRAAATTTTPAAPTATTPTPPAPKPKKHPLRHLNPQRLSQALRSAALSTRQVLRVPSNALVVLQGLPGCLPWGVMLTYMNDFLAKQKGLSVREATMVLLVFGLSGGFGVLVGGAGGQWLYNRRKEALAVFSGSAVLVGIAPVLWIINADLLQAGVPAVAAAAAAAGAVASVPGPCMRAVMLNVNPPAVRGSALALQSLTDDLGKGVGPVVVAGLIGSLGRTKAFNLAVGGWIPCGFLILGLVLTMRRDEKRAQEALALAVRARRKARREREVRRGMRVADLEDGAEARPPQEAADEELLDELELELELELGSEDDEDDLTADEDDGGRESGSGGASGGGGGSGGGQRQQQQQPPQQAEVALTTSPRALVGSGDASCASSVDSDRALLSGGGGGFGGSGGGAVAGAGAGRRALPT